MLLQIDKVLKQNVTVNMINTILLYRSFCTYPIEIKTRHKLIRVFIFFSVSLPRSPGMTRSPSPDIRAGKWWRTLELFIFWGLIFFLKFEGGLFLLGGPGTFWPRSYNINT